MGCFPAPMLRDGRVDPRFKACLAQFGTLHSDVAPLACDYCRQHLEEFTPVTVIMPRVNSMSLLNNVFSMRPSLGGQVYNPFVAPGPGGSTTVPTTSSLPGWICTAAAAFGVACNPAAIIAAGLGYLLGSGDNQTTQPTTPDPCPEGTVPTGDPTLPCAAQGSPGYNDAVPQGRSGMFGLPAFPAQVVGERMNSRGQTTLIRQCPRSTVLGIDNLCYAKGAIPRKLRKWKPTPRPPVTRQDAVAIMRAASAKNRVKALAEKVDFKVSKK